MPKMINEGIIQGVMDAIGFGTLWTVLKGRFWRMIRTFGGIIDIWKADTAEEVAKVKREYASDTAAIKARYRAAESAYAQQNSMTNGAYGDNMLFFNPALAMTSALVGPLMNPEYRTDTRRLLVDTGIADWGLTPDFIANWIKDEPNKEQLGGRAVSYGPDGKTRKTDIFLYDRKEGDTAEEYDKMDAIMGLFVEAVNKEEIPTGREKDISRMTKAEATELAKKIATAYETQGIFKEMLEIGQQMKERKEALIVDVVEPARITIDAISSMVTATSPEQFLQLMDEVARSNKSLKNIKPAQFETELDAAVESFRNDNNLQIRLAAEINMKPEELTTEILRNTSFIILRNRFAAALIEALDVVYEETLEILLEGVTEKGLKVIKQTEEGEEYAKLIESNIQNLEQAIKSLETLEKQEI